MREGAVVGAQCILGKGTYIDFGVHVGDRCKLENGAFVFHGFTLQDAVFVGPGAMLLNDHAPRATNPGGMPKTAVDWTVSGGLVEHGASVGGGAVILPGVRIGRYALVGAGAVVTRDVPPHGIVYGNPARLHGLVCECGQPLRITVETALETDTEIRCESCGRITRTEREWLRSAL
ncbi:acyltransferase [Candidatus Nephthysia bennettiae]|uniref:acyltransferase n=1 Tax=Candidatus Nephthysia bennettiae TaxID=3127016 RepID=UPI0030C6A8A9